MSGIKDEMRVLKVNVYFYYQFFIIADMNICNYFSVMYFKDFCRLNILIILFYLILLQYHTTNTYLVLSNLVKRYRNCKLVDNHHVKFLFKYLHK